MNLSLFPFRIYSLNVPFPLAKIFKVLKVKVILTRNDLKGSIFTEANKEEKRETSTDGKGGKVKMFTET